MLTRLGHCLLLTTLLFCTGANPNRIALPPTSARCLDFGDHPRYLSTFPLEIPTGAAVDGDHLFVANQDSGLVVLDIGDPGQPVWVSSYPGGTRTVALDVELDDEHAYLCMHGPASEDRGIAVLDVSNRSEPTLVSMFHGYEPLDAEVDGDVLFTVGYYDFVALDLSDPNQIVPLGPRTDFPGHATRVAIQDSFAYLVTTTWHLSIFDVSDPSRPQPMSALAFEDGPTDVVVEGDLAYVSTTHGGLKIVDVSDRSAPELIASVPNAEVSFRLAKHGSHVLLSDGQAGVRIIDVSDPQDPREVSRLSSPRMSQGEIVTSGKLAIFCSWLTGLQLYDLSAMAPQRILAHGGPLLDGEQTGKSQIQIQGHYLYASGWPSLHIYDVRNPRRVRPLSGVDTGHGSYDLEVHGNLAYVASGYSGMGIVDVQDPREPRMLSSFRTRGQLSGNSARHLTVRQDVALVPTTYYGGNLYAIDVSNPESPQTLSIVPMPSASAIDTWENWAYVSHSPQRAMSILDIADPAEPILVHEMQLPIHGWGLAAGDGYAYVVAELPYDEGSAALHVIDVRDPNAPVIVDTVEVPGGSRDLVLQRNRLYAALREGGIAVFDVSVPTDVHPLGVLDPPWTGGGAGGIAFVSHRIYVAASWGDLWVYPSLCSDRRSNGSSQGIAKSVDPQPRVSLTASNPVRRPLKMSFALDRAQDVRAIVFDIRGRRVRDLLSRRVSAGTHDLQWNGLDHQGRPVSAGVYLLRIETPSSSTVQKFTLLR